MRASIDLMLGKTPIEQVGGEKGSVEFKLGNFIKMIKEAS